MSIIIIRGKKLEFSEIHDHLLKCEKCRKAREDFHKMFEWHKKALDDNDICPRCGNPEHLEKCKICRKFFEKFKLTLSAHMIELVVTNMKLF